MKIMRNNCAGLKGKTESFENFVLNYTGRVQCTLKIIQVMRKSTQIWTTSLYPQKVCLK